MKKLFLLIIAITSGALYAQDFYLPVTSTSDQAIESYYEALNASYDFDETQFHEKKSQAIAIDPNFFMMYAYTAFFMRLTDQLDSCRTYIDRALDVEMRMLNTSELVLYKALSKMSDKLAADISDEMDQLIAKYPNTPQAYYLASMAAFWLGNFDRAITFNERLTGISANFAPSYNALGYSYMMEGENTLAKQAFEKYIDLNPEKANPYDSMGEFYFQTQDYQKAVENYQKACDMGMQSSCEKVKAAQKKL